MTFVSTSFDKIAIGAQFYADIFGRGKVRFTKTGLDIAYETFGQCFATERHFFADSTVYKF